MYNIGLSSLEGWLKIASHVLPCRVKKTVKKMQPRWVNITIYLGILVKRK